MSDTADATFESILEDLYDPNSTTVLPQSTQDYLDQVLSPPPPMVTPMDWISWTIWNLYLWLDPMDDRCQWECQWISMIFELGRYTCYHSTSS
ncbi:hypothetical protein CEXT_579551 [Caerostris extrusa]|uniref:Uncharacterized protein n=1 Tax=Caerostris extrusa TaxID=172846 RepID=A0AAV4V2L4_CAEEX|nr:hypothetical protein CEXT_579551 [Caerostris extrusa]